MFFVFVGFFMWCFVVGFGLIVGGFVGGFCWLVGLFFLICFGGGWVWLIVVVGGFVGVLGG